MTTADMMTAARSLVSRITDPTTRQQWANALPTTPGGTARQWFKQHHGQQVHTLQCVADQAGELSQGWAPGPRTVDASRATYATMDGSRTDYAGTRVEAMSADTLVTSSPWGDRRHVTIYRHTASN